MVLNWPGQPTNDPVKPGPAQSGKGCDELVRVGRSVRTGSGERG